MFSVDCKFSGELWMGKDVEGSDFCLTEVVRYFPLYTYLLTYLLTHSVVQSPSWEANWFVASQEIPRTSRNPKVHYRTHKRPPSLSILGQPNPVHIPTSHLLEIHSNIIHPSTPRSPQWSPSLRFLHQDPIHSLTSPKRATCIAQLILLDFITPTILGEEFLHILRKIMITSTRKLNLSISSLTPSAREGTSLLSHTSVW